MTVEDASAVEVAGEPVFVLCFARSGSTLLRFILDAHPELSCPPETGLPLLCAQLARVWSLIEGAPLPMSRDEETPPEIPQHAIAGMRATLTAMIESYLKRRGKRRYCDKSLSTARFADLLMSVYPQAKLICLYRHPMDMIASGLEACPWGLNGYGFDAYSVSTPGNHVLALGRYWLDNASSIHAVEKKYPDSCIRVRYEDLASDPEAVASEIFSFLGVRPASGVSSACFAPERERFGPADHKIWYTSGVTANSLGRGWSVPAHLLGPQVLAGINELASELGYVPVDASWGTTARIADPRVGVAGREAGRVAAQGADVSGVPAASAPGAGVLEFPSGYSAVANELGKGLMALRSREVPYLADVHLTENFVVVCDADNPGERAEYWLVNLGDGTLAPVDEKAQEDSDWDVVASTQTWKRVLSGELNLSSALRSNQLRYCNEEISGGGMLAEVRLRTLARLLSLTRW